jgi:M6 family metalloprotease-like protein
VSAASRRVLPALLAAALLLLPAAAAAQEVRAAAEAVGRRLPQAYERRLRSDPEAFEIRRGWTGNARLARRVDDVVQGTLPLLVVQALFSDSPEPGYTPQQVQSVLFDGPAPYGTLRDFYLQQSGNRLIVSGKVLPWVRTSVPRATAVENPVTWINEALQKSDASVDFGQFDNDGPDNVPNSGDDDGVVDAVAFHFLESSAACNGPGIWPHRSGIAGWPLPGGLVATAYQSKDVRPNGQPVLVDDYITQSTVTCGGELLNATTIAHELGHILGLPDLYHMVGGILPSQRRWVLGCWSLMAGGSWGCGSGSSSGDARRPPSLGPWEKGLLGWTQEIRPGDVVDTEITLQPVVSSGQVLRIQVRQNEYFLVEFRPRTGFDSELAAGGVLIHHVDRNLNLFPCAACPRQYSVSLVEADGNGALLRTSAEGGNRGEAGDVWGANGRTRFTTTTTPGSKTTNGGMTEFAIHDIVVGATSARLRLSTVFARGKLLKSLLRPRSGDDLSDAEKAYMDANGNQNGRYDLGDFRIYLKKHPAVAQQQ